MHALYPELQPILDFSIYSGSQIDVRFLGRSIPIPEFPLYSKNSQGGCCRPYPIVYYTYLRNAICRSRRDVNWKWKYDRDVKKRGHDSQVIVAEMLAREAAYKRWIDFQKTNATTIIKLHQSQVKQLGRYEFNGELPEGSLKVEMMIEPAPTPLPTLPLLFDLAAMLGSKQPPFLLAAVPSIYWGGQVITIHIDGLLSPDTMAELEKHLVYLTGIPVEQAIPKQQHERVSAVEFAQLLIAWRFLEQVNFLLKIPGE